MKIGVFDKMKRQIGAGLAISCNYNPILFYQKKGKNLDTCRALAICVDFICLSISNILIFTKLSLVCDLLHLICSISFQKLFLPERDW